MIGTKTKGGLVSSASGEEPPPLLGVAVGTTGLVEGLGLGDGLAVSVGVGVGLGRVSSVKPVQTLP